MAIKTPIIATRESGKGRRKDNVRLMAIDIPIHIIWFCRKFFVSASIFDYTPTWSFLGTIWTYRRKNLV
jgi:hypothetical protein